MIYLIFKFDARILKCVPGAKFEGPRLRTGHTVTRAFRKAKEDGGGNDLLA